MPTPQDLLVSFSPDCGKTLTSTTISVSSANTTIVAAGNNRTKVYAFSLTTTSTTSAIAKFQSGSGGTTLWQVVLQAPSGANAGANLSIMPPASLFDTASGTLLNLNLSTAIPVEVSVAYFDEA